MPGTDGYQDVRRAATGTVAEGPEGGLVSGRMSVVTGQLSLVSGQWSVVSRQWSVVSGQSSVVSGQSSVVSRQWSVVVARGDTLHWQGAGSLGGNFSLRVVVPRAGAALLDRRRPAFCSDPCDPWSLSVIRWRRGPRLLVLGRVFSYCGHSGLCVAALQPLQLGGQGLDLFFEFS